MNKQSEGSVMKLYRMERWLYTHNRRASSKIIYHLMQIVFGCTIPPSTELGKDVIIAHSHGIVLHQNSKVGDGTALYQNVCLGGRNGSRGPVIGRNCFVGAGACVLGEINIGNNVKIGANSVVITDVPDNCTVVGVPGKIVKKNDIYSVESH